MMGTAVVNGCCESCMVVAQGRDKIEATIKLIFGEKSTGFDVACTGDCASIIHRPEEPDFDNVGDAARWIERELTDTAQVRDGSSTISFRACRVDMPNGEIAVSFTRNQS